MAIYLPRKTMEKESNFKKSPLEEISSILREEINDEQASEIINSLKENDINIALETPALIDESSLNKLIAKSEELKEKEILRQLQMIKHRTMDL